MIGSICSQFHWTVGYLLWKVNWITIQMMLADMPWYDYDSKRRSTVHGSMDREEIYLDGMDPGKLKNIITKLNG